MRNIILLLFIVSTVPAKSQTNPAQWDQAMRLKSISIRIHADLFTATTFMEMEFFNPREREMEGLYRFSLQPGQVITAFQLDLNGKYRDGSIEEKWKAANAYNTIVGKRIDPALLQFESDNSYSLRIYPVPAKASRKVTITLQQSLKVNKGFLDYVLPFAVKDAVDLINIHIEVETNNLPVIKSGLLASESFSDRPGHFQLAFVRKHIGLNQPVSFSIPFSIQKNWFCTKAVGEQTFFALWYKPGVQRSYRLQPKSITVYWDASSSATTRDIKREINFLKQYISYTGISQLIIIPFNYKILDTATFNVVKGFDSRWQSYLHSLGYDGATQLGCIDFSGTKSDIIFLFSDGRNSFGNNLHSEPPTQVYCIHATTQVNQQNLQAIVGQSGGRYINLNTTSFSDAIQYTQEAENLLLDIQSVSGKTIIDQELPMTRVGHVLITGVLNNSKDKLLFHYGNNNSIRATENIEIDTRINCATSAIDRMPMLISVRNKISDHNWYNVLEYGIKEKIVTQRTSYIVLERVEDYIKFNITPPKELEEQVAPFIVKKDIKAIKEKVEQEDLFNNINSVVNNYNRRILWWDKNEKPIYLNPKLRSSNAMASAHENGDAKFNIESFPTSQFTKEGAQLNDVVVIGYATSRAANLTAAITRIRPNEFFGAQSIEQVLTGRVAGLHIQPSSTPGQQATSSIRGASSLGSNRQPLFVLDGIRVEGDINQLVNINDIHSVDVLKDPTAALIYGSQAANGAIVITTKKWTKYRNYYAPRGTYKLKNMEDVEYLLKIKNVTIKEKLATYKELKAVHGDQPGFYFDMAQHLFESGFRQEAYVILTNAAEVSEGSYAVLRAIGYTLENWKYFDEAIKIYSYLLIVSSDLRAYSDLAMAHYQNGNYQTAVDILYGAISKERQPNNYQDMVGKEILLNEMNAIIAIHEKSLNLSSIDPGLIKSLPVDLRIVLDCNMGTIAAKISVTEPGGKQCSIGNPTSNGGKLSPGEYHYKAVWEYEIRKAIKGKYRINLEHYNVSAYYSTEEKIPTFIKITTFKNFGRHDQQISIENVIMDNQSGTIEIGEVSWK